MKFRYKEVEARPTEAFPQKTKTYRPIVPVVLEYENKKIGCEALLDSGADWNLLPSVIGEIVGIDIESGKKQPFGGIGGGSFVAYFREVIIFVGGWPIKVPCGFSSDIPDGSMGVLGHVGFFDRFITRFDTSKLEVELKKIT